MPAPPAACVPRTPTWSQRLSAWLIQMDFGLRATTARCIRATVPRKGGRLPFALLRRYATIRTISGVTCLANLGSVEPVGAWDHECGPICKVGGGALPIHRPHELHSRLPAGAQFGWNREYRRSAGR